MLKVLITGVSGLLGSNLALCWRNKAVVTGVVGQHQCQIVGISVVQANLMDQQVLDALINRVKPDVVVHCAALANIDICQREQHLGSQLNIRMPVALMQHAKACGAKFVFISTDAVYDGSKGNWLENETSASPVNFYAKTKIDAEQEILKCYEALVIRTSFYGFNIQSKNSLVEWGAINLAHGQQINGFTDVISSNIFTYDLADLIWQAIESNLTGIYNIGAKNSMSKFQFLQDLALLMGFDKRLVVPLQVDQSTLSTPRSKNLSLDVSKLEQALAVRVCTSQESLQHFVSFATHHPFRGSTWLC